MTPAIDRHRSALVQGRDHLRAHVRAFFDSNGDGIGDFPGLTQKLDYLQRPRRHLHLAAAVLSVAARDDGYDIADYTAINPMYGTLDDFKRFLDEAHARDIRVITELVINHTSDQHPWFQRARRAPKGSPERDYYVWSDTDTKYAGTRIIFTDTEKSNWTWDPVAGQYYWHRFFSHQPDLNFDNPAVLEAVHRRDALLAGHGRRRAAARRDSVSGRARRHDLREPARDARRPQAHPARARRATTTGGCCWPRRTSGRRTCAPTSATATSATWRSTSR